MSDLIDRQAALDAVFNNAEHPDLAYQAIRKLPSAQPEITRCKDCKYWGHKGFCTIWDEYISNEDFYCGCAERREG